jgi:hypothetical protein
LVNYLQIAETFFENNANPIESRPKLCAWMQAFQTKLI